MISYHWNILRKILVQPLVVMGDGWGLSVYNFTAVFDFGAKNLGGQELCRCRSSDFLKGHQNLCPKSTQRQHIWIVLQHTKLHLWYECNFFEFFVGLCRNCFCTRGFAAEQRQNKIVLIQLYFNSIDIPRPYTRDPNILPEQEFSRKSVWWRQRKFLHLWANWVRAKSQLYRDSF